jgi:tetratricopeptide (TPR) repeat protein
MDPLHADSISDKGAILYINGKYRGAIALFDKALKIDKRNIRALRNKAKALRALGDRRNAKKCDLEAGKIESNQKNES